MTKTVLKCTQINLSYLNLSF